MELEGSNTYSLRLIITACTLQGVTKVPKKYRVGDMDLFQALEPFAIVLSVSVV